MLAYQPVVFLFPCNSRGGAICTGLVSCIMYLLFNMRNLLFYVRPASPYINTRWIAWPDPHSQYAIDAKKQLAAFEEFCNYCLILPLDRKALDIAANIYVDLRKRGELIGEVDILISGIALKNDMGIVTCNTDHFTRISSLHIVDWRF